MLNQLKQLKQDALNGCVAQPYQGICVNIEYDIDEEDIKSWSGFSGNPLYPIIDRGNSCYSTASAQYKNIEILWEGGQLKERLSLLDHLISCYADEEIVSNESA